jgi:flagellin-like hook-associated protein FlgL
VTYLDEKGQNRNSTTQTVDQVSAGLNASFDQLTMTLQRSGGVANQVDNAKTAMSAFGVQLADTQSVLLDTDMAAATASYTRAQTLLNAAQAMFARLQQSNLFSKL